MIFNGPKINPHDLRRQKAQLREECTAMLDTAATAGRDLNANEQRLYNRAFTKLSEIDAQLEEHAAGAHMQSEPSAAQVPVALAPVRSSIGTQLRDVYARGGEEVRAQIDALAGALRGGIQANADLRPSGDGGVFIPSAVQTVIERNYAAFAPVVSVARLFPTDDGETTTFPVISDSESAVQLAPAALSGADATVSGDTAPTSITGPQLKAWKASSQPVFITRELATDSPINIIEEVVGALLARIIRFENLKQTKGVGTTEAEGFLTNSTAYHAGAVALDLDIALDLAYNVPALYRPNGVYMASDLTVKYLRKLKTGISGDKRSLWRDAFEEGNATLGTPAKLHGYPLIVNNDMDSVASDGTFASVAPLVFGDFSRFVVRQAEQNRAYAYIYPVPAKDGRAAILFRRSDSKLLVDTAISKLIV